MQVVYNNKGPQSPGALMRAPVDFWNVADGAYAGAQLPPDREFSELVELESESPARKPLLWLLLILLVGGAGYLGFDYLTAGRDLLEPLIVRVMEFVTGEPYGLDETPAPVAVVADEVFEVPLASATERAVVEGNPYWVLPNTLTGQTPLGRLWTSGEEETFRVGVDHRYTYQRWQTVMDVRRLRLRGSEAIFWNALADKKLWTRLWAAIGLAEFNVEVSLQVIEDTLKGARPELVANFFERFVKTSTPGQRYVMRQAIKLLNERGRLVVLRALDRANDDYRDLYVVAALYDPGKSVRAWVKSALLKRHVTPEKADRLIAVIDGADDGLWITGRGSTEAIAAAAKTRRLVASENKALDQELQAFDGPAEPAGDVAFYDKASEESSADDEALSAESDMEDSEAFEYESY